MFLFAWKLIETKSPNEPIRFPLPGAAERLRGVLDDAQLVLFAARPYRAVAVHREAGEVDRDHGPGARRDGGLEAAEVDCARDGIDVHEDGPGAHLEDDIARGDPAQRRRNHLVPGPTPAIRRAISIVHVPELKARTGRPPK